MSENQEPHPLIREFLNEMKEMENYVKEKTFLKTLNEVKSFMKEKEVEWIDSEEILYCPDDFPFSLEDFFYLVDAITHYNDHLEESKQVEEKDNPFEHRVCEYDGLIFRVMSGQGTMSQIIEKGKYYETFH